MADDDILVDNCHNIWVLRIIFLPLTLEFFTDSGFPLFLVNVYIYFVRHNLLAT